MPEFAINQEVDVRFSVPQPWYPGVVTSMTPNGACYVVALDAPVPTRLAWTGVSRPLGDDSLAPKTFVFVQTDKLAPEQLIKDRGA